MLTEQKQFAIIGTGVVGTVLAILLEKSGLECIGVNTRSQISYERFSKYLQKKHLEIAEIVKRADFIFITTQDGFIETVAKRLSEQKETKAGQFWIHCSGSLPSNVMCRNPLLPVNYVSIHPLQAFACVDSALTQMAGTHFGIEGSNEISREIGRKLVNFLGGIPHLIDPEKKTLYHAGAVVISNYLVALTFLAVQLFEHAGINKKEALESLLPLLTGSYQNIKRVGLPCALTGPIARGDSEVVAKHLREMPAELRGTYKGLGRLALELGSERKKLNGESYAPEVYENMLKLLT